MYLVDGQGDDCLCLIFIFFEAENIISELLVTGVINNETKKREIRIWDIIALTNNNDYLLCNNPSFLIVTRKTRKHRNFVRS